MGTQTGSKRRTVLVVACLVAVFPLVTAIETVAQQLRPSVSVRTYGAVGNGSTNDTAAIQRANDAVAAQGGGTVTFPAGTYIAAGVRQDSNVELIGSPGAVLKHPDGVSNTHIVNGRVWTKRGWTIEGSRRVSVSDTKRVVPGANIAIRGAGGASQVQATVLQWPATAGATTLSVYLRNGWGTGWTNYLLVENEIVSYSGMSGGSLQSVRRGLFGTAPASHGQGAPIAQLNVLYARVVSVGSNWIDLDRVAVQGVANADVYVGSVNMAVRNLTLDGSRRPGGAAANPFPVNYELARWVTVEGCTIRNGDHGAINFDKGTSESTARSNLLVDNGTPAAQLGAGIWLYRGASDNVISGNTILGNTYVGIQVDDRTETSTEWDAPANRNSIVGNRVDIPGTGKNASVFIIGSENNVIESNDFRSTLYGIWLAKSTQGTRPATTSGTIVRTNHLAAHRWGLYVTGADNWFERNELSLIESPIVDGGAANRFIENLIG